MWKIKQFVRSALSLMSQSSARWVQHFGGGTKSAQTVNIDSAMQITAVWRAVRLTASTVASLPIKIYRDGDKGPELVKDSPTHRLLKRPNTSQTIFQLVEQLQACVDVMGNGYLLKHRGIGGQVVSLTLLDPSRMIDRDNASKTDWFWEFRTPAGTLVHLPRSEIIHVPGFSLCGRMGMSPLRVCREALGMSQAVNENAARLFASGMRNSGFLKTNSVFDAEQRAQVEQSLQGFMGNGGISRLMVLEAGMDFTQLNMSAADAELLVTRKFEIEEIGRIFDMPPVLLGHSTQGQTMFGSGVSAVIESWLTLGLRQRLRRIEQIFDAELLTDEERRAGCYFKFNADALLQTNSLDRIRALTESTQKMLMTLNEARAKMDLPAIDGGDELMIPVNLVPLSKLGDNPEAAAGLKRALQAFMKDGPDEIPDA